MTEKLSYENIIDGMKVILVAPERSSFNFIARIGATAQVVFKKSSYNWINIIWDKNEFVSKTLKDFLEGKCQCGGGYPYECFISINSPEGQKILKQVGKLNNLIEETIISLDAYCNCQNPSVTISYAGIGPQAISFQFCRNCKKEKI